MVVVARAVLILPVATVLVIVAAAVTVAVIIKADVYLRTYYVPGTKLALPCRLLFNVSNSSR